jgi:hypothetical protein
MIQQDTIRALAIAMSAEIACFEAFLAAQRSFSAALRERDWGSLQIAMGLQGELAGALSECEKARSASFDRLRTALGCENVGLYRAALLVPEPERTELTDLYRRLKLSAMRAKFENASASEHAVGNRELLRGVLEELFPEKKGRIYGRSGHALQPGLDALLLNTAL